MSRGRLGKGRSALRDAAWRDAVVAGGHERQCRGRHAPAQRGRRSQHGAADGETVLMTAARPATSRRCGADRPRRGLPQEGAGEGSDGVDVGGRREQRRRGRSCSSSRRRREGAIDGGSFTPYLFAVRAGHVDAARGAARCRRGRERVAARRHERAGARGDQRALRAGRRRCSTGAPIPNADGQGWTALHQIAWSRRHNAGFNLPGPVATGGLDSLDLVRKLVEKGADVNARMTKEPRDGNRNHAEPHRLRRRS